MNSRWRDHILGHVFFTLRVCDSRLRVKKPCGLEQFMGIFEAFGSFRVAIQNKYDAKLQLAKSSKLCDPLTLSLWPLRMLTVCFEGLVPFFGIVDTIRERHDLLFLENNDRHQVASKCSKIVKQYQHLY